jgi:hypothetical protein
MNMSYVAHIIAEEASGPRGDAVLSPIVANDIENLMLLCDCHHRLIDLEAPNEHPVARLQEMKRRHEDRISTVTAIEASSGTNVLVYGARIGEHDCLLRQDLVESAVLPHRWPLGPRPIQLDLLRLEAADDEVEYWQLQPANLRRQFERKVRDRVADGDIRHLSIFALAPQPLLFELGRLIGDITAATVHQLHREPQGWNWRNSRPPILYAVSRSDRESKSVALKLGLSATINDDRVHSAIGSGAAIWSVSTQTPHNDVIHTEEDLSGFRRTLRLVFDQIKARHGEDAVIHVFPALPVSAAVEVGRTWMPKADLPLIVYDQSRRAGGFVPRLAFNPAETALPPYLLEKANA